jgi:hypothetical protein
VKNGTWDRVNPIAMVFAPSNSSQGHGLSQVVKIGVGVGVGVGVPVLLALGVVIFLLTRNRKKRDKPVVESPTDEKMIAPMSEEKEVLAEEENEFTPMPEVHGQSAVYEMNGRFEHELPVERS